MDPSSVLGLGLLGLVGSLHCAGMCGGLAVAATARSAAGVAPRLTRTLVFALGKATTYVLLGLLLRSGVAAAVGPHGAGDPLETPRRVAAVLAGCVLVLQGLAWLRGRATTASRGLLARLLALVQLPLARANAAAHSLGGWAGSFAAGLVTGFLPCGLSLSAFALATQTDPASAALGLALFGLATTPALGAVVLGGGLLATSRRASLQRALGLLVVLFGLFTMTRGSMGHGTGHGGHGGYGMEGGAAPRETAPHGDTSGH